MNNGIIKHKIRKYYELCEHNKVILFGIWWNKFYSDFSWDSSLVCSMYQSYVDTHEYADIRKSLVSRRITERDGKKGETKKGRMGSIKRWVKEENTNGCLFIRNSLKYGRNMELIESIEVGEERFWYIILTFNGSFIVSIGNWSTEVYLTLIFILLYNCELFTCFIIIIYKNS